MTTRIEYSEAVELLQRAVAEKGADYVYQAQEIQGRRFCTYFDAEGSPSCIIGHVLAYKGITADEIAPYNNSHVVGLIEAGILDSDFDETFDLLAHVQNLQDNNNPWGTSVEEAILWSQEEDCDSYDED